MRDTEESAMKLDFWCASRRCSKYTIGENNGAHGRMAGSLLNMFDGGTLLMGID